MRAPFAVGLVLVLLGAAILAWPVISWTDGSRAAWSDPLPGAGRPGAGAVTGGGDFCVCVWLCAPDVPATAAVVALSRRAFALNSVASPWRLAVA